LVRRSLTVACTRQISAGQRRSIFHGRALRECNRLPQAFTAKRLARPMPVASLRYHARSRSGAGRRHAWAVPSGPHCACRTSRLRGSDRFGGAFCAQCWIDFPLPASATAPPGGTPSSGRARCLDLYACSAAGLGDLPRIALQERALFRGGPRQRLPPRSTRLWLALVRSARHRIRSRPCEIHPALH